MRACTYPDVLIRWQSRYSADARTASPFSSRRYLQRLIFHGQAQGPACGLTDMPIRLSPVRLPLAALSTPVHKIRTRVTAARLVRYSRAIVLLPASPSDAAWAALPFGRLLREVYALKALKAGDSFELRVGAKAETLLPVGLVPSEASVFERLQLENGGF